MEAGQNRALTNKLSLCISFNLALPIPLLSLRIRERWLNLRRHNDRDKEVESLRQYLKVIRMGA
jgi:hypothetical protein